MNAEGKFKHQAHREHRGATRKKSHNISFLSSLGALGVLGV
jgi:hypothetical protein